MTKIRQIKIENFQSHEETTLGLEDGLNIILGPSDQGKSAILRAIRWVLSNEPKGTDFIRFGTAAAKVTLKLDNHFHVIRERSKSKNRYVLIYPDGTSSTFEGFGVETPDEIAKVLGVSRIELDRDIVFNINIGGQLDPPFLLSESPAVRSKAIGKLIGIQLLDRAGRECTKDIRRRNQTSDAINQELMELDEKLKAFEILEELGANVIKSEELIKYLEAAIDRKNKLTEIQRKLVGTEDEAKKCIEIIGKVKNLDRGEIYIDKISKKYEMKGRLEFLKTKLKDTDLEVKKYEEIITQSQKLSNTDYILKDITNKAQIVNTLKSIRDRLDRLQEERGRENSNRANNLEKYDFFTKQLMEKLKAAGVCPVCGSTLDFEKLKETMKHYEEVHLCR